MPKHLRKFSREQILSSIIGVETCKEALIRLGLYKDNKNYPKFKQRLIEEGVDVEPLYKKWRAYSGCRPSNLKIELSSLLKADSIYNSSRLKKRLVSEGVLQDVCSVCGIGCEWNGQPLTLQLDHINGINNDHRIENLRIICPNCHTQTHNYCSRNFKKGS